MDELLRRSKKAFLIVRVDLYHSGSRVGPIHSLEKALENMESIQNLWIDGFDDVIERIQSRLNVAAPLLQSLHLSGWAHRFVIKEDMLPEAMPDLRKVYLSSVYMDWSSPIFNGLTELTLGDLFDQPMAC